MVADTGAKCSCISSAQVTQLEKQLGTTFKRSPSTLQLVSASGDKLEARSLVHLPLQIESRFLVWPFQEVQNLESAPLAGVDLLRQLDAQMDWDKGVVRVPQPAEIALVAAHDMEIAPLQAGLLRVTALQRNTSIRCPNVLGVCLPDGDAEVYEGIVQTDYNAATTVSVPNHSSIRRLIHKGDIIAALEPTCEESWQNPKEAINAIMADTISPVYRPHSNQQQQQPQAAAAHRPPPPERARRLLHLLNIDAPAQHIAEYRDLLLQFHDVFSLDEMDIGQTSIMQHDIALKSDDPVHVKQFRVPLAQQQFIQKRIQELAELNLIEPSTSPYNTPMFAVPKKAMPGEPIKYRLIQDLRALNAVTKQDKHSICDVRACLDRIGARKATVFSSIDLRSGYYQMGLTERSRPLTAFTVPPMGKWQWRVTTMGLTGAPASFCKLMEEVMAGLDQVLLYLDDLLCASTSHQTHLPELRQCLVRLRRAGLKINPEKSNFGAASVQYLGHTVSKDGFTIGEHKFHAIKNFPEPTTPKKVRQFLGLASFFRQLIPSFQADAGHLTQLLTPAVAWRGGPLPPRAKHAFISLREKLLRRPVVAFPDPALPFTLATDAAVGDERNPGGLGAVLTQEVDGAPRVIAYAARSLKQNEKGYSAFVLELQAVLWAIEHFSAYLKHTHFTVLTDHKPVEKLSKANQKTLHRLHEKMNEYPCEIVYRQGLANVVADALSRNPPVKHPVAAAAAQGDHVAQAQKLHPVMQEAAKLLHDGAALTPPPPHWPKSLQRVADRLCLRQGLVAIADPQGLFEQARIVIPPAARDHILINAHSHRLAGHKGVEKTTDAVQRRFWWPQWRRQIADFVQQCPVCQSTKPPPGFPQQQQPSMHPIKPSDKPNFRVHADLFGPLNSSEQGNKWVLTMTDAFSKFVRLIPLPNKEAETVARAIFTHWVCVLGPMHTLITDQGREFNNAMHETLLAHMGINYKTTSAIAPSVNGQAEIFNKSIAQYLKAFLVEGDQWEGLLGPMALAYNSAIHKATRFSPAYVLFGQEPRRPALDPLEASNTKESWAQRQLLQTQQAWATVHQRLQEREETMMKQQKASTNFSPMPGERVLLYFPLTARAKQGFNPKLIPAWAPATVLEALGPATFRVRPMGANKKDTIVRSGRLRPFHPRTIGPAQPPPPPPPATARATAQHQKRRQEIPPPAPAAARPQPAQQRRRSTQIAPPPPPIQHHMTTRAKAKCAPNLDYIQHAVNQYPQPTPSQRKLASELAPQPAPSQRKLASELAQPHTATFHQLASSLAHLPPTSQATLANKLARLPAASKAELASRLTQLLSLALPIPMSYKRRAQLRRLYPHQLDITAYCPPYVKERIQDPEIPPFPSVPHLPAPPPDPTPPPSSSSSGNSTPSTESNTWSYPTDNSTPDPPGTPTLPGPPQKLSQPSTPGFSTSRRSLFFSTPPSTPQQGTSSSQQQQQQPGYHGIPTGTQLARTPPGHWRLQQQQQPQQYGAIPTGTQLPRTPPTGRWSREAGSLRPSPPAPTPPSAPPEPAQHARWSRDAGSLRRSPATPPQPPEGSQQQPRPSGSRFSRVKARLAPWMPPAADRRRKPPPT